MKSALGAAILLPLGSSSVASGCTPDPVAAVTFAVPADSPQSFSTVGPFQLIERSGATVTREDLLGRPWAASFLFTRCSGPCPRVRSTLKALQGRLKDAEARIVTFSVDPAWDRPEVLREYAQAVQADPRRWLFLTGEQDEIHGLIRQSFLSAVEQAPPGTAPVGEQVSHRTQIVAVDKKGRVRGFYHGESEDQLDLLVERLAFLQRESE